MIFETGTEVNDEHELNYRVLRFHHIVVFYLWWLEKITELQKGLSQWSGYLSRSRCGAFHKIWV